MTHTWAITCTYCGEVVYGSPEDLADYPASTQGWAMRAAAIHRIPGRDGLDSAEGRRNESR